MFRDRLKAAVKKVALRAFKMEWDAENTSVGPPITKVGKAEDAAYIPPVVDGAGDTPGPNHRENIGRTWLVAQVVSGAGPLLIDIRPPAECINGMLPGAMLFPGSQVKSNLDRLPPRTERVVIYDQIGGDESAELAAWLRTEGWSGARKLVGGYAEWIEHDEPVEVPQAPAGGKLHIGMPVERKRGGRGVVQTAASVEGRPVYTLLMEDGTVERNVGEDTLRL